MFFFSFAEGLETYNNISQVHGILRILSEKFPLRMSRDFVIVSLPDRIAVKKRNGISKDVRYSNFLSLFFFSAMLWRSDSRRVSKDSKKIKSLTRCSICYWLKNSSEMKVIKLIIYGYLMKQQAR